MKKIPLGNEKYALIDNCDFLIVSKKTWSIDQTGYPRATAKINGKHTPTRLHRFLINVPKGMVCDHIDGDKLNNTRKNLRVCTHQQNSHNNGIRVTNTSGYKGVSYSKLHHKYECYITINYKIIHLGLFNNKKDAAIAYNKAAKKYHGKFAQLNSI